MRGQGVRSVRDGARVTVESGASPRRRGRSRTVAYRQTRTEPAQVGGSAPPSPPPRSRPVARPDLLNKGQAHREEPLAGRGFFGLCGYCAGARAGPAGLECEGNRTPSEGSHRGIGCETDAIDSEQNLTDVRTAPWSGPARVHARVVAPHDEIEPLIGALGHEATARPPAVAPRCGVAAAQRLSSILPIWLRCTS